MSTSTITVALNEMGHVAAASIPTAASEVTSGMAASLGQTLVELEVTDSVAEMAADKFLVHLSEHAAVKAMSARFATASSGSSQEVTSGCL